MSNKNTTIIECPECGKEIDIHDGLTHQLEKQFTEKFEAERKAEKDRISSLEKKLSDEKDILDKQKEDIKASIESGIKKEMKSEREKVEAEVKKSLAKENSDQFSMMEKELKKKSEQVKDLNKSKAEIEKLKREKDELKSEAEAEAQKELTKVLIEEKKKIQKVEEDRNEMKVNELIMQLEDQKKLTEEMKKKQEQGSMKLQGEVQEVLIEKWLVAQFPLDTIEEIKAGAKGADCLQIVNTHSRHNCGMIYYESKRTKTFQPSWIEKFKADMRNKGAGIGVLVTESMPTGMDRAGQMNGVWVCNFEEFKALSKVLRESVIQVSNALVSQENKGGKMEMLYTFLSGNEFRMQIEAIVEGFSQMKNDLESEKRSMQRIWKQRDKQIEKVIHNTVDMYGSIKGIAGNAIQPVKQLELGGGSAELEE
ncbi:MAG: DUF2130 domain-containing protein [Candidatus Marinimicrobia bacterium]|nr:DUF2130 domain-containing protein [Candidatus Neomarinimicrobiota bacterium]MBL7023203.1 DUF2130 domain-containing protein [Candidatus Neomarinimicrobiota bacterium]MBL7109258.1 DUF2130 domain-containing protein [Candidatus Neomarinimicrobiota bacterium]